MKSSINYYFYSSTGRKQMVAITGLLLCGFLVSHLTGNLLLLISSDTFNLYAHKLTSMGPLLYVIETVLALTFLIHLTLASTLALKNNHSRGKYQLKKKTGRGTTFASQSMPYTGIILLIFLILHLINLKFGTYYEVTIDGVLMRDLTRTTIEYFRSPIATAWYVVAMLTAALHTSHGFASAFHSLGLNHEKYFKIVKRLALLYAITVGGGFAFLSIWCHLKGV